MAINLQKGQTIDLRKSSDGTSEYDLSQVTIGLGWDVAEQKSSGGFFGKLLGGAKKAKIMTSMRLPSSLTPMAGSLTVDAPFSCGIL